MITKNRRCKFGLFAYGIIIYFYNWINLVQNFKLHSETIKSKLFKNSFERCKYLQSSSKKNEQEPSFKTWLKWVEAYNL